MRTKAIIVAIAALALTAAVVVWVNRTPETGIKETPTGTKATQAQVAEARPSPSPTLEPKAEKATPTPAPASESFAFQTHEFDGETVPVWGARLKRIPWGEVHYALDVDGVTISDPLNPQNTGDPVPERYWLWRQMEYPSHFKYPLPDDHTAESPRAAGEAVEFIYKGHIERWVTLRAHFLGDVWSTVNYAPLNDAARRNLKEILDRSDFSAVRGTVVDERGRPVPFAKVLVRTEARDRRRDYYLHASRANREGVFEVDRVEVGPGMMWAEADGYQHFRDNAIVISSKGAVRPVTIELEPTVMVSGVVRNADGRPVAGARVLTFPSNDMGGTYPSDTTDAHGRYRINTLRDGAYNFLATAGAYGRGTRAGVVVHTEGPEMTVDLSVGKGPTLDGTVVRDYGDHQEPLGGVRVYGGVGFRRHKGWKSISGVRLETTSRPDGSFTLENLPTSGSLTIGAIQGFCYAARERVHLQGDRLPDKPVVVKLPPPARIPGRVVDTDGNPIRGATVTLDHEQGYAYWDTVAMSVLPVVETDEKGEFLIPELRPKNRFTLAVSADEYASVQVPNVVPVEFGKETDSPVEVRLTKGGTIEGRVVASESRKPVEGFLVAAQRINQRRWAGPRSDTTTTDAGGNFRFEHVAPGGYAVAGWSEESTADAKTLRIALAPSAVSVAEGQTTTLDLDASIGGAIRGRVVEQESGEPIAGANVYLQLGSGPRQALQVLPVLGGVRRKTDDAGEFDFDPLPAGPYELVPNKRDHVRDTRKSRLVLTLGQGERKEDVELSLMAGGTIEGRVQNRSGEALAGVRIMAVGSGGTQYAQSIVGGVFTVKGLLYGTPYTLVVSGQGTKGYCGESEPVQITEKDPTQSVVLVVSKGASVSGHVTDESGAPLPGVQIACYPRHHYGNMSPGRAHNYNHATSDAEGAYEISGLFDGTFQMSANLKGYQPWQDRDVALKMEENIVRDIELKKGLTFEGSLTNGAGEPLSGWRAHSQSKKGGGSVSAEVDSGGRFKLEGVSEGSHYLLFSAPYERSGGIRMHASYMSGTFDMADPDAPRSFIVNMDGALAGRVIDETTRKPVTGLRISLNKHYRSQPARPVDGECVLQHCSINGELEVDAEGRFLIDPIPEGEYQLALSGQDIVQHNIQKVVIELPPPTDLGDIVLAKGLTVTGRLVDAGTGEPMVIFENRNRIHVYCERSGVPGIGLQLKTTGEAGCFRISGLPSEFEALRFISNDFEEKRVTDIQMAASGDTDIGDVALMRAIRVIGRFVDGKTKGDLPTGTLRADWPGARAWLPGKGQPRDLQMQLTPHSGRFEIRQLPAETVRLQLTPKGALPVEVDPVPAPNDERVIDLGDVPLEMGGTISGTVRNEKGEPLPGASVIVQCETKPGSRRRTNAGSSGADGKYAVTGLSAGRIDIYVQHQDYAAPETQTVEMKANATVDGIDFVLTEGHTLEGVLVDYDGHGLAGWNVNVSAKVGQGRTQSAQTDSSGAFTIEHIRPGEVQFTFSYHENMQGGNHNMSFAPSPVTVPGGETEFVLPLGGVMKGRVVYAESGDVVPIESMELNIQSTMKPAPGIGALRNYYRKDASPEGRNGAFQFENLPSGKATLTIVPKAAPTKRLEALAIGLEKPLDLGDIEIEEARELFVRPVDAETGDPIVEDVKKVHIRARGSSGKYTNLRVEMADQSGRLRLIGAGASQSRLSIHITDYDSASADIAWEDSGETDLGDVKMRRMLTLRARFVEADGGKVYAPPAGQSGVKMLAIHSGGSDSRSGRVETDGVTVYQVRDREEMRLRFEPIDRLPVEIEKVPDPNKDGVIDLGDVELEKGASLRVKLEGPDGETVLGGSVQVTFGENPQMQKHLQASSSGEALFEGLPEGTVKVSAGVSRQSGNEWIPEDKPSAQTGPESVEIGKNSEKEVTLRFPSGG